MNFGYFCISIDDTLKLVTSFNGHGDTRNGDTLRTKGYKMVTTTKMSF